MNILVVCQHYYPEPFRITEICESLVENGHHVEVVTGLPNYPMGIIYPGYEKGQKREEIIKGVIVHRCFTIERRKGTLQRFLNYYSFVISSKRYIKSIDFEADVVFVNQLSPVMMAEAGCLYAKKKKKPMVLYSLDIWPESLEWGGIKKNSLIFKYYHHVSSRIYCEATVLAATSRMFEKYFEHEFGIKSTLYLPQFAEDIFTPTPIIDNNKTVKLVFAGNIGTVQSIETILQAAKLTENVKSLEWHIYGDGSDLERLKELNERMNLTSVTFHGRKPLEEMPEVYSGASAMLVTMQKKDILSYTLPGKVQSYLAAGKPIIGAIDGETMRIIREAECGFCGPAEDSNLLAENVMRFIQSGEKNMMGQNARKYYDAHFSKIKFMEKLQNLFDELCSDGVRK